MNKEFVKDLEGIFILGRGQSLGRCPLEKPANTEFWGCNNVYRARKLDRLFLKTDPYITQHRTQSNLIAEINEHDFPVYTLGLYPELKNNVRYPMEEVIKEFKTNYILNTAAHMIALAIMQKPKHLYLAGVDMSYGTNNEYMRNEKACVEGWLGMALGRRIKFTIAEGSTLLKRRDVSNYYGYVQTTDNFTMKLQPKYSWGRPDGKCAYQYKIVSAQHNL